MPTVPGFHEEFLRRAIALAVENVESGAGGPFGAVIVKDGKIVAEGANQVTATNDPTAHAEVTVIRLACAALGQFDLSGCELYSSCEPCPMCFSAIYWARLDAFYYAATKEDASTAGFDDGLIYRELALAADQRKIPARHIEVPERLAPMEAWVRAVGKTLY